jgi:hypothetical protein
VSRLVDYFSGRSLESVLKKARQKLASGDFEAALRAVAGGLARYPEAVALRDLNLSILRAQSHAGMQDLRQRVATHRDPAAFEQLIAMYLDTNMREEAMRTARDFASACPEGAAPHVILGELSLQGWFRDLQARDGHRAHGHLMRAAELEPRAIKPLLLLAEFYYCAGALGALSALGHQLEQIDPDHPEVLHALEMIADHADPAATGSLDGRLAQIELEDCLANEPTTWPAGAARLSGNQLTEERTQVVAKQLVRDGIADEVVVLQRGGTPLAHAREKQTEQAARSRRRPVELVTDEGKDGLADVVRDVAHTISVQARELDLGAFRHCAIEGPFGRMVVGRVAGGVAGALRTSRGGESNRLWERIAVKLEGAASGSAS